MVNAAPWIACFHQFQMVPVAADQAASVANAGRATLAPSATASSEIPLMPEAIFAGVGTNSAPSGFTFANKALSNSWIGGRLHTSGHWTNTVRRRDHEQAGG